MTRPSSRVLGIAAVVVMVALLVWVSLRRTALVEIAAYELTVSDLARAEAFYTRVLHFERDEVAGDSVRLRLGDEKLTLREASARRPLAATAEESDSLRFQHIAIVVSDMNVAYAQLVAAGASVISTGPQTLPDWNYNAAQIEAVYFRDPDRHVLELIRFPANKGEPRWHATSPLFLGIDHSALVVTDTARSRRYYRDVLGMSLLGESTNYGLEQDHLNGLTGSRVKISSLRGSRGPGIELLEYVGDRKTPLEKAPVSDWQIDLRVGAATLTMLGPTTRDPDGHAIALAPRDVAHAYLVESLRRHFSRYLMEGAELGIFMIVALYLTALFEHPRSPARRAISSALLRRGGVGLGIALTVVVLIYCRWGRQSGAQFNPSVTLAMLGVGRIEPWDALCYVVAQFVGGWALLVVAALPIRRIAAHESVRYVVTEPGKPGTTVAVMAELAISFVLMASLRLVVQSETWTRWVGVVAGLHLFVYILFESPLSGMSLNPARTVASALPARSWKSAWIYFVFPVAAMQLAAALCER